MLRRPEALLELGRSRGHTRAVLVLAIAALGAHAFKFGNGGKRGGKRGGGGKGGKGYFKGAIDKRTSVLSAPALAPPLRLLTSSLRAPVPIAAAAASVRSNDAAAHVCRNAAGTVIEEHQYHRSNATCRNTDVCNATNARDPCGMSWYRDKCPGCGPISIKGSVGTIMTSAQKYARPVLNQGAQKAKFCEHFRDDFRQDRSPPWIRNILEKMKMTKDSCDKPCFRNRESAKCPRYS